MSRAQIDDDDFVREASDPDGVGYWVQSATLRNGQWWAAPGQIIRAERRTGWALLARLGATLKGTRKYDGEVFVLVFRKEDESPAFTWSGPNMSNARDQADVLIHQIEAGIFEPTE
jgi:hypothetical protein